MSKKFVSLSLICALICTLFTVSTTVNAKEDSLAPYRTVLEELNVQLGTDYTFPTAEQMENNGECYVDLVEFYNKMSIDEFKDYVITAYDNEKSDNMTEVSDITEDESEISPQAYTKKQKYYYDTTGKNYLFINSTVYTADGKERYSSVDSYGHTEKAYPYYSPSSMSSSKSADFTKVTCTFSCVKYIAKNLINATNYTVKVTFKASGGDVYTSVEV